LLFLAKAYSNAALYSNSTENNIATLLDIPRYLQHFQPFNMDKQYTQKEAPFFLCALLVHAE
jgi:hypothetical protein